MSRLFGQRWRLQDLAIVVASLVTLHVSAAPDVLVWNKQQKRLDAEIQNSGLSDLLTRLSKATGWQVFVEPGTEQSVSVKFKNLTIADGLKRMLGDLNFALLPQTNAPPRLFVFRNSLQEATQQVHESAGQSTSRRIPNELIVTLRGGGKQGIDALARSLGAQVVGGIGGLNTYRLRFSDEEAAQAARDALSSNPDVTATDSNYFVDRPIPANPLEVSSPSSFSVKPKLGTAAGNQTIVALIDTPVQPLDTKMNQFMLPPIRVAGDPPADQSQLSHGTSMAETILHGLTYAPAENGGSSVRVLPVDVYGSSPDTSTFDVAKGIYAALGSGATIINMSLGGNGDSQFLAGLIHAAHDQGVLFFGAAGNQPTTDPTFPAAYPDVVAVTAGDRKGNIAPYANRGDFVDVIAPGASLVDYQGQSYLVRGTSAATAYVSGTAAGYRAAGTTPQNVEAYIRQTLSLKASQQP